MQTIISQFAVTFIDDAIALSKGLVGLVGLGRGLTIELFKAARRRVLAPVDRLARACDVAGVLAARQAAMTRSRVAGSSRARHSASRRRRKRGGVCNVFHGLQDLT